PPPIGKKTLGKGRVVALSIPADADWHNWTSDPSYLLIMQDLVRYLAADRGGRGLVPVGEPLQQPVDLAQYDLDAQLTGPRDLKVSLQAAAPATSEATAGTDTVWR